MAKTGLLVLTNPKTINHILPVVKRHVRKTLYVQLSPQCRLLPPWFSSSDHTLKAIQFRKIIAGIYTQASSQCQNLDVRILLSSIKYPFQKNIETRQTVDVVIFDKTYSSDETSSFMQSCVQNINASCEIVTINENLVNNRCLIENAKEILDSMWDLENDSKIYENVVLGGTFDRLHCGHKILLSEALLHCSKKLTVGVTDLQMIKSKILWELIETCEKRINDVHDFLSDVDNGLQYNIVPISDPFGPTKEDPDLQMIVVSAETLRGGHKVNEVREQTGLCKLDILNIDILETLPEAPNVEEAKVSSSNFRIRLLGEHIKDPKEKFCIPSKPYIIGLTGCIASGKTSVAKRLAGLGAGVINCDILAHNLYRKGEPCYDSLIQLFGSEILDEEEEVNRRILGSIVFNNKEQLDKLNSLLWPEILQRSKDEAQNLYKKGHKIVVMDAAVLLQAGWAEHCHETWVCIIPPDEAVKRIQSRNGLSVEDAERRILAQPSNVEIVKQANIVLCTLWDPEFTQKQVEKAWKNLHMFLKIEEYTRHQEWKQQ